MRKPLVLLLLLLTFCSAPGPALAGPFATELTQILNHVELVLSYAVQAAQLATQIQMLVDAVKNSVRNPNQLFWNIQGDLNSPIDRKRWTDPRIPLLRQSRRPSWQQTYPGYSVYAPTGYYNRYQAWSQTTLDTVAGAMRAARLQGQQLNGETSLITSLAIRN